MKLLSMTLHDFKGVKDIELKANGKSLAVRGANGTGKSTLMNAFLWLLTGKDSQGRSDYNIFPLDQSGKRLPGSFPAVTAVLSVDSGTQVTLSRTLNEKWTKRRGAAESEYNGDETKCTIDDVPVSITEYNQRMAAVCSLGLAPVLLNASYFSEQTKDYKERRKLLLSYFGDLQEMDILRDSPTLAPLIQMLQGHSVDEYRRICVERRKKYNDALNAIPARIDEVRKQVPTVSESEHEIRGEIGTRNVAIAKLRYEIEHITENTVQRKTQKELDEVKDKLLAIPLRRKMMQDLVARDWLKSHNDEIERAFKEKQDASAALQEVDNRRANLLQKKNQLETEIQNLRAQWVERNNEECEVTTICPTCGQEIPMEQVQAAQENCNVRKAEDLAAITATAKSKQAELACCCDGLETCGSALEAAKVIYAECCRQYDAITAEKPPAVAQDVVDTINQEEAMLREKSEKLMAAILDAGQTAKSAGQAQKEEISKLECEVEELQKQLAEIQLAVSLQARIEELQKEQKKALKELETAEQGLALCEEYTHQMVTQLTERVNEHFNKIRWRLFETQKNGGLKEVCEASVDGVPYGSLNTAGKMQVNVEIVEAFSKASGYIMPLFLDNRESVTKLTLSDEIQVINLKVDETAAELTFSEM